MNYSGNEVSASKVFAGASCLGTTFNNRPAKFLPPVLTLRCHNLCFHIFLEPLHIRMVLLAVAFLSYLWNLSLRFAPSRSGRRQLKSTTSTSEHSRGNEYFGQILVSLFSAYHSQAYVCAWADLFSPIGNHQYGEHK